MAVRLHYHRVVHGQLGRLPDGLQVGGSHHLAGRSLEAVQDQVLADEQLRRYDLLPAQGLHRGEVLSVSYQRY